MNIFLSSSPIPEMNVTEGPKPRRPRHSATLRVLPPSFIMILPTCELCEPGSIESLYEMMSTAAPPMIVIDLATPSIYTGAGPPHMATAICAPRAALFLINSTFASDELP